jgi:putative endonuclease
VLAWFRRVVSSIAGGARQPANGASAGSAAERLAADWLARERRMRIVARNWRDPRDLRYEIDIVASDGEVLVFVEVKSRPAHALVPGYFSATTPRKKRALLSAARAFVAGLRMRPRTVRYDVVEIVTANDGAGPEVRHFENVPLFPKSFLRGG